MIDLVKKLYPPHILLGALLFAIVGLFLIFTHGAAWLAGMGGGMIGAAVLPITTSGKVVPLIQEEWNSMVERQPRWLADTLLISEALLRLAFYGYVGWAAASYTGELLFPDLC